MDTEVRATIYYVVRLLYTYVSVQLSFWSE